MHGPMQLFMRIHEGMCALIVEKNSLFVKDEKTLVVFILGEDDEINRAVLVLQFIICMM